MKANSSGLLKHYSILDLVIIAVISSLGIATKPIVVPLVHIVTGPLFIPGGAVAGGLYMLWIVLGIGVIKKFGTGTLIGIVQGIMVIALGMMGSHGMMSLISYTLPGVAADLVFILGRKKQYHVFHYVFGCMAANMTGTMISNVLFFRLPTTALLLLLVSAALSGAVGGVIASRLAKGLDKVLSDSGGMA